jgi:hypothetical protein
MAKVGSPTAPEVAGQVAASVASGQTYAQVAKAVGISVWTVRKIAQEPQTRAFIAACRAVIKEKSAKALLDNTASLADVIGAALKNVDTSKVTPKDVDALSRAALNMEKIAASVSGEGREPRTAAPTIQLVVKIADYAKNPEPEIIESIASSEPKALPGVDGTSEASGPTAEWDGEVGPSEDLEHDD